MTIEHRICSILTFLYGSAQAETLWPQIQRLLADFRPPTACLPAGEFSEKDAVLITYGDNFSQPGEAPLRTLQTFLREEARGLLSGVHILPFYPYSSDDGFSVIDYRQVNPELGGWEDIDALGRHVHLMFDAVINHISRRSEWFQGFIRGQQPFVDYFITPAEDADLSRVIRPRTLPLLTRVETSVGEREVWTTFSDDQMDLNYANPAVLLEIVALLLFYVEHGAQMIRLDAIAYLWKEPGSTCLHLPQTHAVVKLLRAVLDAAAPHVVLITETNVPHLENISYFGEVDAAGRTDEAQLVYQFPLAPLTLHTFLTGSAERLSAWAAGLDAPGLFFNFLASHDGIGLSPAHGILSPAQIDHLAQTTLRNGGQISYRANPDGSHTPYELNITFYDALYQPEQSAETNAARFLASQAVLLSLAGVPGIYVHSLLGSRNWQAGLQQTGRARTINREKFNYPELRARLADSADPSGKILRAYLRLLQARQSTPAFHPAGRQKVVSLSPQVFGLERVSPDESGMVLSLINISAEEQTVQVAPSRSAAAWVDLLNPDHRCTPNAQSELSISLSPYQICWLTPANPD